MSDALTYISTKFDLDLTQRSPIEIPDVGRDPGLARLLYLLGHVRGVEVGVERALYSEALLRENPLLHLTCVDAWEPYVGYRDHVRADKLERFYVETRARLEPYRQRVTILREWSVEAAQQFEDGSLDFVYLDGNHSFPHLTADLAAWSHKVRAGGIVAGHDFRRHRWPNQMHVEQVIYGWTDAYDIHPWFVLGRKEKRAGEIRDDGRTWLWIHEPRPTWRKGQKAIKQ